MCSEFAIAMFVPVSNNIQEQFMADIIKQETINASSAEVWAIWDRFGDIADWHPGLEKSALVKGSKPTGLGARRKCDLIGGKNYIMEEIVDYEAGHSMAVHIYDGNIPVKSALVTFRINPDGPNKTNVSAEVEFKMKMGLLGAAIKPLAKKQLGNDIAKLLSANKGYAEKFAI